MLRTILILVALIIVAVIGLAYAGILSLNQTQSGQAPKFEVEVKDVDIGTTTKNVQVPSVGMETRQVEVPAISVGDDAEANAQTNAQ
jgi:Tfp pilus assembly protein PilO